MAREDIQINTVAPQANTVAPADVYSRPYHDRNAGSGFMELAKSLGILGDTIAAKTSKSNNAAGQAEYEHYGALAAEFGDPAGKNASLITGAKDGLLGLFSTGKSSATVRNKVEEVQGDSAASTDFFSEGGYGSRLMPFANDPAGLQAEIKKIRAEAYAKVKDRPAYGNNYIKQLDAYTTGFQGKTFENQQADFKFKAEQSIAAGAVSSATPDPKSTTNLHDHVDGASNSLISYLTKGKPDSYITDLQPEFSSRISKMIEAAPPEIRARIKIDSGARTPARQAELIADKLGGADRAAFNKMVAQHGPEKGGAMWASTFPQAAKARGIGHMIALPGRSLHQHGFAIDFFRDPVAEAWMHKNAGNFGLYYPMGHEPWHIEQIGARGRSGPRTIPGEGQIEKTMGPLQPSTPNTLYRGHDNSPNFFDNYYKVMNGAENATGDPNAKNPLSSASSYSQFIDSTWIEQYGKVYGETNLSREEILALRTDRDVDKKLAINYAKENAKTLEGYAIPVNTTTLLMAHQLGGKGAAMVLQAFKSDSSQPIEDVLSDEAMAANPQYTGKTVGQVYAAAAGKTGEFTNPVGGAKERTSTAYNEGIAESPLGPAAFNKSFAEAIISQANAMNAPEILDSMPDEIMAQPEYAAKVQATREKIATEQRSRTTFAQAQAAKRTQAVVENTVSSFAARIIDDPAAEITPEEATALASLPNGGFEAYQKIDAMKKAHLIYRSPADKRLDAVKNAEAVNAIESFKTGAIDREATLKAIHKIDDPVALKEALEKLALYQFVPQSIADSNVTQTKTMFLNSNYGYIENTPIKDAKGKAGADAQVLYNRYLSVYLAELGHKASEVELYKEGGIIERVHARVLLEAPIPTAEDGGLGGQDGSTDTPIVVPVDPANPATPPIPGITPEMQEIINRNDRNRMVAPTRP